MMSARGVWRARLLILSIVLSLVGFGLVALAVRMERVEVIDRLVPPFPPSVPSWRLLLARGITYTGSTPFVVLWGLCLTWGLWRRRRPRRERAFLWVALVGSSVLNQALKWGFARPRPPQVVWWTHATGWSFPSGHAMIAVVCYGATAYILGRGRPRPQRIGLYAAALAWAVLIALSRVYLGVHYLTDVIAGVAIGLAWLLLVILLSPVSTRSPDALL